MDQTEELKESARKAGADLVGVADLGPFKEEGSVLPPNLLEGFTSAVAIAIRLDDAIIEGIEGAPTPDYAQHYRAVNAALDTVTAQIGKWIRERGFPAVAIPASQILDEDNLLGSISHKAVARMAGIGWQGKSLLIVSPQYGPRIRLATVLTNMPLRADGPLKNRCGTCGKCAEACPASAIRNAGARDRYATREEALCFSRCVKQAFQFKARAGHRLADMRGLHSSLPIRQEEPHWVNNGQDPCLIQGFRQRSEFYLILWQIKDKAYL